MVALLGQSMVGVPKALFHYISSEPPHLNMPLKLNGTFILEVCISS